MHPRPLTHIALLLLGLAWLIAAAPNPAHGDVPPAAGTDQSGRLGLTLIKSGTNLTITDVTPGSPAFRAGIDTGDILTSIDCTDTAGMTLTNAVQRLHGPVGAPVQLQIHVPGQNTDTNLSLTRAILVPTDIDQCVLDSNIGVLAVYDFYLPAPGQIKNALASFQQQQVTGVVLDLRHFRGGVALPAVAGLFLGPNKLVSLGHSQGRTNPDKVYSNQPQAWAGPLIVLTGSRTAGSAEILAADLKYYGRARLTGQKTAGYDNIRTVQKRPDGTPFLVTVGTTHTAADEDIDGQGVIPDVTLSPTLSNEETLTQAAALLEPLKK